MARTTYVLRDGELVDKRLARPLHASDDAPMIRPDGMDPIQSMADGRHYDSRSAYYASLREHGCEIVSESDRPRFDPPPGAPMGRAAPDIKTAIEQLRSR